MPTTRNQYLAALTAATNKTVRDPQEVMALCPHLSPTQIKKLGKRPVVSFALPPVLLASSFKIGCYRQGGFRLTTLHKRTPNAYADGKLRDEPIETDVPYMHEAMAYAKSNWSGSLYQASWHDVVRIVMHDPAHLQHGVPQYVAMLTVALARSRQDIENDYSQPRVQLVDNAIVTATSSRLEGLELEGSNHSEATFSACARCGGSLGQQACHGCGRQYHALRLTGWGAMSLPPKLVRLLRGRGYVFEQIPSA